MSKVPPASVGAEDVGPGRCGGHLDIWTSCEGKCGVGEEVGWARVLNLPATCEVVKAPPEAYPAWEHN